MKLVFAAYRRIRTKILKLLQGPMMNVLGCGMFECFAARS